MADQVTATGGNDDSRFTPHPEMQAVSSCVDVIDMGEKVEAFEGNPEKLVHKVVLGYRTGETNEAGECIDVFTEFTLSMNEKAKLRKHLEAWRGKPYSEDAIEQGVPLHKLVGQPALLSIAHKTSKKGRTYAVIASISPVPKGLAVPSFPAYERAEYWEERKAEYAKGAAEYRKRIGAERKAAPAEPSDDLPF
jgi:hypothetical protein